MLFSAIHHITQSEMFYVSDQNLIILQITFQIQKLILISQLLNENNDID